MYFPSLGLCQKCITTRIRGFLKASQTCETCPDGFLYNSITQECYKGVKPEPCDEPLFYIFETGRCQECEATATSGYVKIDEACEECTAGKLYDKIAQKCYTPDKPEDCVGAEYFIKATSLCTECESTETSGYNKDSQSCETCPDG